jgi:hypothetical protein
MRPGHSLIQAPKSLLAGLPLPANTVECWDSTRRLTVSGGLVSTWSGVVRGADLTGSSAGSSSAYAADPGFFSDNRVVKSVGGLGLRRASGGALFTSATPWVYLVMRQQGAPGSGISVVFDLAATAGVGSSKLTLYCDSVSGGRLVSSYNNGASVVVGPAADLLEHRVHHGRDAAGVHHLTVDGVTVTGAVASAAHAFNTMGLGRQLSPPANNGNSSARLIVICNGAPTAPEIAALDAWIA